MTLHYQDKLLSINIRYQLFLVKGVIELTLSQPWTPLHLDFTVSYFRWLWSMCVPTVLWPIHKKAAKQKSVSSKRLQSKSLYHQEGCQAKVCIVKKGCQAKACIIKKAAKQKFVWSKKAAKQKSVSSRRLPSKSLYHQEGCQAKVCIIKKAAKQKSVSSKRLLFGHPILVFLDSSVLRNSTMFLGSLLQHL